MISQGMVCGTGLSNQPKPGDPSNYSVLRASSVFGGIQVSWTFPALNPFAVAHTLLFRSTSNDFNTAAQLSVVAGSSYFDQFPGGEPVLYYYWIKFVSVNGTYGDLIGPASCWANPTILDMMQLLTDKIDRGVLAQSLKTEIDRISYLADGLSQEATYRASDDAVLADAFTGLQASFDSTVALVLQETHVRSTADSALAQQITTVQSQLGGNLSSVQTLMQTNINTTNGVLHSIGALWTAKVSVNGLIGGFGVYNDGQEVQAGFDVDLFWVGRTNANKVKPFIISEGVVYIDNAMIRQLTADKIDTRGLSIKDSAGNIILSAGSALNATYAAAGTKNSDLTQSITNASLTATWNSVSGSGKPQDNATWGATFGTNVQGQMDRNSVWTYIANGAIQNALIGDAEVGTLKIAGNAVSFGGSIISGGSAGFYTPVGGILTVVAYSGGSYGAAMNVFSDAGGDNFPAGPPKMIFYDDGFGQSGQYVEAYGPATGVASWNMGAGSHYVGFSQDGQAYNAARIIWMFFQR